MRWYLKSLRSCLLGVSRGLLLPYKPCLTFRKEAIRASCGHLVRATVPLSPLLYGERLGQGGVLRLCGCACAATAAARLPRRLGARGYAATVRARLLRVRTRVLRSASRGMRAAQAALPFGVLHLPSNHKNQLVLRVDVQFRVDVAHMAFCGGRADDKRFGNAFCRHALG